MLGRHLKQVLILLIKSNQIPETKQYKVTQLNIELEKAIKGIESHQLKQSDEALTKFIQIWPYVEGKIQTKTVVYIQKLKIKFHIIKVF